MINFKNLISKVSKVSKSQSLMRTIKMNFANFVNLVMSKFGEILIQKNKRVTGYGLSVTGGSCADESMGRVCVKSRIGITKSCVETENGAKKDQAMHIKKEQAMQGPSRDQAVCGGDWSKRDQVVRGGDRSSEGMVWLGKDLTNNQRISNLSLTKGMTKSRVDSVSILSRQSDLVKYAATLLLLLCLGVGECWGDTYYVIPAKCNVSAGALVAGADGSEQLFKTDESTVTVNTDISTSITSTAGVYYNSTSTTYANLTKLSNYSASSGSSRTMRGIKVESSKNCTITVNSKRFSKLDVIYRCESTDSKTLTIDGQDCNTSDQKFHLKSITKDYSSNIIIANGSNKNYDIFVILTEADASCTPCTFKSGDKVYFKDQSSNFDFDALWKVSSGNVYAYFWNDTENAWSSYGTPVDGDWNAANTIYEITVPGSGKEYQHVIFTRGNNNTCFDCSSTWDKTTNQEPCEGKNLFYVSKDKYADHIYYGSWGNFTPASKTVYFDNRNVTDWTTAYVRIGHGTNNAAWGTMTKVAGTRNLYSQTTSKYISHTDFSIANKAGWTGSNHIDQPEKTYTDGSWSGSSYKMTKQTNYQQYAIEDDIYLCPKATSVLEHECQFYQVTNTNSSSSSRIDENTTALSLPQYKVVTDATNCTVGLVQYTADDFSTSSALSSGGSVDPTRYVGVTVTPSTGHEISSVSLTENAYEQHTSVAAGVTGKYAIMANCTIAVVCTPCTYTITYKDGGNTAFSGVHIGTQPTSHTYGTATALKKASKAGYVFGGWYTTSACTGDAVTSLGATAYTANITLYAKWTAVSLVDLVSGTLYKASDMVPAGVTISSTAQAYPGVSSDQRFNLLGATTSNAMESKTMSSTTVDGTSFDKYLEFKAAASLSTYTPSTQAIQFKIPAAGKLEVWINSTTVYLSNGTTESSVNSTHKTFDVSAGTYYLYAKGTGKKLYGIRFKATHSVSAVTSTGNNTKGSVSADPTTVVEGGTSTITASPAAGYKVTNWAVSGTGSTISPSGASNANSTTLTMGTADATVTVTFGPKPCTITLNNHGATNAGTESVAATYNSNTNLTGSITCPNKTGYLFGGYYTGENGTGTQVINDQGAFIASVSGYTDASKNWIYDGSVTLHAKWTAITLSLSFDPNSIEPSTSTSVTFTITTNAPNADVNSNPYYFAVYNFAASNHGAGYINGDHALSGGKSTTTNVTLTEGSWYTQAVIILAGVIQVTSEPVLMTVAPTLYTVTFDANGGSVAPSSVTQASGGASVALPTPTYTGYTCTGWWTSTSGGTKRGDAGGSYTPSSNETVHAQWTCTTPTIGTNLSTDQINKHVGDASPTLTIAASVSTGTVDYQWYSNDENNYDTPTTLTGQTSASYSPSTSSTGTTYYFCKVTNHDCSSTVYSNIAKVVVSPAITISTPTITPSATVYSGSDITLSLSTTTTNINPSVVVFFVNDGSTTYEVTATPGTPGDAPSYSTTHTATFKASAAGTYTVTAKVYDAELIDNFDPQMTAAWTQVEGGWAEVANNPEKEAVNGSPKVMKVNRVNGTNWKTAYTTVNKGTSYDYIYMRMYHPVATSPQVKINNGGSGERPKASSADIVAETWQMVRFDRAGNIDFIFPFSNGTNEYIYVDDIILSHNNTFTEEKTSSSAEQVILDTYDVTHTFTNASRSSGGVAGARQATNGTDYSVTVAAADGYILPAAITVSIGGDTKTQGTEYTWNPATGVVTIGGSYITGAIVITITGASSLAATLEWNLNVNTAESSIGTASKTSTAYLIPAATNMTNLANYGSLTITSSAKENLTSKIAAPSSEDANKYMYVTFTVPSGYKFTPTSISVKYQPVDKAANGKFILTDGIRSITKTQTSMSSGSIAIVSETNAGGTYFMGTVTLKIYCYGSGKTYRLGSPIAISGNITPYSCTTPSTPTIAITDDDDDAMNLSGSEITFTTTAGNTDGSTTYTWYRYWEADRSAAIAAGELQSSTSNTYVIPFAHAGGLPSGDNGVYYCLVSNGGGCEAWAEISLAVTPSASQTITYHLNGASWVGGYTAPATFIPGGAAVTLPIADYMVNTGYTFNGWYANSDLSTGGVKTETSRDTNDPQEFWAKWTENTYTITYNKNDGSATGTTDATNGHYVTVADCGFELADHMFAGWNTKSDGSGDSYSAGDEIELTADMTLYAQWGDDYTISWDASAKLNGVAATPNLGGGNYTITASVSSWTGTLTTSMISALTDGVTITNVAVDNSSSPKTITATFNVGASVTGESISFELDVPAAGDFGAKSSTKDITIDRCTGSSSGSDGVLFSAEFKDSGLGTSNICAAANTPFTFTTDQLKSTPVGGSISAYTTNNLSHMTYATNAISIAGSDGVIEITLDNAIATNDLFTYVNVNSSSSSAYLRHTSADNTTDQIALTVYNNKEAKVRLTSGFDGKTTLYIVRKNSDFKLHKAAVIRPAFLMLLRDDTPTSNTDLSGTDVEITTSTYLMTIQGGRVYYTSPSEGNLKIKRSDSKNYINFNNAAGYVKVVLNDALQEGDVIGFDSYNTNNLDFTTTAEHTSVITTTNQLYTVNSSSALKGKTTFYIWRHSGSSDYIRGLQIARSGVAGGTGGTDKITPTLTWTPALESDADWDGTNSRLAKETGDADFTFTVTQDKNSLGAITYASSNTSVATVTSAGKVHIVGAGEATITATMAESGCYEEATAEYDIYVEDNCEDAAGTITVKDLGCGNGYELTVSGHTIGDAVTYQWYKDGVSMGGSYVAAKCTVTVAGEYYVVVDNTGSAGSYHCAMASDNTITIEATETATATKIVDSWYVKNGRRTPDIALVQTENANGFTVKSSSTVIWNSDGSVTTGFAGCGFYLGTDGIIYLKGQKADGTAPSGLTAGDETLTITATSCGGDADDVEITIHKQAATTRPSVAFVVDGTKEGDFDAENEDHSVGTALYDYLDYTRNGSGALDLFDLTPQNVYSTVDEKAIRQHYSQFDAIIITDDPSTSTKIGKKSCVNAFGTMIDIRPILTMEAYVSSLSNWKAKGISGNPTSPNPRQYAMKLECKDHAIFSGLDPASDNVEVETVDGVDYWTVTMVDKTKTPYAGLDDDEETGGGQKPALQGFSASNVDGLLLLGEISEGTLYAGVERQDEPAARLMLLGVQYKALPSALTPEGLIVIKNALKYLLKTDMEEVDDCSNYFTDAYGDHKWSTAANWSKGKAPDVTVKARILKPCIVDGTAYAAQVDIATSGKSSKGGGIAECTGKLTIDPTGALIVGGEVRSANAPYFNTGDLMPTTVNDLVLNTNGSNQSALIFNNDKGDTKATVNLYSLGRKPSSYQYQYFAIPMEYLPVNPTFANETHGGTKIYTYVWEEGTSNWTRRKYYDDLFAFEGLGITTNSTSNHMSYTMAGNLVSTAEREITLTYDGVGNNIIGNSYTAPINISSLVTAFASDENVTKTVYVYCAGRDAVEGTGASGDTETAGQWLAIPMSAAGFPEWKGLKVIPTMQAFLIQVTGETSMTLNYDEMVRSNKANYNEKLRAPQRFADEQATTLTRLRVADSQTHTDLYLFEGEKFSEGFDNGWEATYMEGDGRSAQLYAMAAEDKMAVLATPELEGTQVGFAPGQETVYTFSFAGGTGEYYLNDIKAKKSTLIQGGNTYSFEYENGDAANRFYISKTAIDAPAVGTGVDNTQSGVKVQKFIYQNKLYILRNGVLYDATGKIVK